LRNMLE